MIARRATEFRQEFAYLTAVHTKTVGDRQYANERAQRVASDVATMLRFMCPAAVTWNVAYQCFPKGSEHIRTNSIITVKDGAISFLSQGITDFGMMSWKLPFEQLDTYMKEGLINCAVFFGLGKQTDFQKRFWVALNAFSRGIATHDVGDRLIYAMSALEHLFLRDEREPIQTGVGERLAFLIAAEPKRRREIVANFKRAYALRSKQIHHLAAVDDAKTLEAFFLNTYSALHRAMQLTTYYRDRVDFLDAIDAVKFGDAAG